MVNKIDSNATGLRFAEESSIKTLPGSPVWYPLEPNGYNDFGGQIKTVAREPINPSRQRRKGVTTDLDASGGFGQDLTQTGLTRLLQGFFFASIREKYTNLPMNGSAIVIASATASSDEYAAASGLGAVVLNDIVFASGFTNAGNNGIKVAISSTATTLTVPNGLVDETPPATARLQHVGHQFASATVDVVVSGTWPRLTRVSGAKDFTTFGLIAGEWVFLGGDSAGLAFTNTVNNGFARVRSVGAAFIEFDKTSSTMVAEVGTGKTIQMFFGNVLQNEPIASNIVRRTYNLERTLGDDGSGTASEYLTGAVPNEMSVQLKQADKVTVDLGFMACDNEQRSGATGVKSGSRPTLVTSPCFNTSTDFTRIKMHVISNGAPNPSPLFAFLTEMTLTINNNVTPDKALTILGAFDQSAGNFAVSGSITAYFAAISAVQSVRDNADVTVDFALVKNNAGLVFDVPLLSLGDGRLSVEKDKAITLPLTIEAAQGVNDVTLLLNEFPYLPALAA